MTVLATLPLETVLLREVARQEGVDLARDCAALRVILLGGAVLPAALRRTIESAWGARVVEIYGSNETMLLGIGCTQGALHLVTDLLEVEILDPHTWAPVPAGTPGILTITSLVQEVMPLVRYVTGDLVQLDSSPCACGAATPTARVFGRAADVIAIGNARVTPYALLDACYEFVDAIGARVFFTVVLRRGIELLVEATPPGPQANAGAERRLAETLGVPVTVQYLERGRCPRPQRSLPLAQDLQAEPGERLAGRSAQDDHHHGGAARMAALRPPHHRAHRASSDPQRAAAEALDHIGSLRLPAATGRGSRALAISRRPATRRESAAPTPRARPGRRSRHS